MSESETVLSSTSPHGNLDAVIEQDDRVAHLWLRSPENENFGLKTCWVRNLKPAPEQLDVAGMREGIAPMLPREFCRHPAGQPPLNPERLEVVWFPEGDAVAVLEDGELLAAIPAWGGSKGFSGYARDCMGQSSLAWGLEDPSHFQARIAAAQEFWAAWDQVPSPWPACQHAFLAAYEQVLGPHTRYFAIDGDEWPPRALIRVDQDDRTYLLTLGMSLRPQPAVEMYFEDPAPYRRIEFAACFSSAIADEVIDRFASYLAAQADLPWQQFTWLGHGHTLSCDVLTKDPALRSFSALLFVKDPPGAPVFTVPQMGGDPVNLLWLIPITGGERALAQESGSKQVIARVTATESMHVIRNRASLV